MSDLAERLASLSPARRALVLERLRAGDGHGPRAPGRIERQPRGPGLAYPLSFAQQRLWFMAQLEPESSFYSVPTILRLRGRLDVRALEGSLRAVVERHEALRTVYRLTDDGPTQVVLPAGPLSLCVRDLSGPAPAAADREEEALRLVTEAARLPFDLQRGPLLRVSLLRLDEEDHILLLCLHHIAADGWSAGILSREVLTLYDALATGKTLTLPPLSVQYVDYAVWQNRWLTGEVLERQLAFWTGLLGGDLPTLRLPTDYVRPATSDYRGRIRSRIVPAPLAAGLGSLARGEKATPFMVLLAILAVLLGRLAGQEDIVIGSPIANRNLAETEDVVGFFINTLALRVDLSGRPTFRQLLGRVRDMTLGAFAHQDLPFERLVLTLQPERDLGRTPMFSVLFNLINTPPRTMTAHGLRIDRLAEPEPEARFDLTFYAEEGESGLGLSLLYQKALFADERAAGLLDQFHGLLEQVVADPDRLVTAYSLVTPAARPMLPDPGRPLPRPAQPWAADLFREAVERFPEAPALSWRGRGLAYTELSRRSEALAGIVREHGLGNGAVVAVTGRRSFGLIAAFLAVLSSGGVLLTLDDRLPAKRRQVMLREARARGLLHVGPLRPGDEEMWGDAGSLVAVFVDPDTAAALPDPPGGEAPIADQEGPADRALRVAGGLDPAYVFFTSGTTGTPQGVLGAHQSLGHFLTWQRATFKVGPGDRAAQLTGLSFDVVLRDILLPLVSGATLCLPPDELELDPVGLVSWLRSEGVTLLHTVPALAQAWLGNLPAGARVDSLRWAFFAGEPLTSGLVERFREVFPEAESVNLYGPTETTLAKTFYRVPCPPKPGLQPLGHPLPDTEILILAQDGHLCGVGEPGEIVIRTPFRTLGYVNPRAEGQGRFRVNPFTGQEDDLLYHSGDRGCYGPDGATEILGRLDHQVKIHGVRVTPEEITAVLVRHPQVKAGVVVTSLDGSGQVSLRAYVVASEQQVRAADLRAYLRRRLPAALVPSVFVFLEALPLTANGKIDRAALPPPGPTNVEQESPYSPPRTPVETLLAGIWADALGLERVGREDNFFALGGDSILAVRIVARANRAGLGLAARQIFESQTVADLAAALPPAASLKPGGLPGETALTWAQTYLWERSLAGGSPAARVVTIALPSGIGPVQVTEGLRAVIARHDALRLEVVGGPEGWRGVIRPPDTAFRPVPAGSDGGDPEMPGTQMLRAGLESQADGTTLLAVRVSPLAADERSLAILADDLATACRQAARGEVIDLGPLPRAFQSWVREHSAPLRLDGGFHVVRPAAEALGARRTATVSLEARETGLLQRLVPDAFRTPVQDALLAGLLWALGAGGGRSQIEVDLEIDGRLDPTGRPIFPGTVGCFTVLCPLAFDLDPGLSPVEVLKMVKEEVRRARSSGAGAFEPRGEAGFVHDPAVPPPPASFGVLPPPASRGLGEVGPPESWLWEHALNVSWTVREGRLEINWVYRSGAYRPKTVASLAGAQVKAVRAILDFCQTPGALGQTPSDFPLARLDQRTLDRVLAQANHKAGGSTK